MNFLYAVKVADMGKPARPSYSARAMVYMDNRTTQDGPYQTGCSAASYTFNASDTSGT